MIRLIDLATRPSTALSGGSVTPVLGPSAEGTTTCVSLYELDPWKDLEFSSDDMSQVVYLLDGEDAHVTFISANDRAQHRAKRGAGVYLEPGEAATVQAERSALRILVVAVPKYTGKAAPSPSPVGYFFQESELKSLIDAKSIRERTFWVNHETGLSDSWDLQLGRMRYAPGGYSPRHVHHPSTTGRVAPEHFYLIEAGAGRVDYDGGSLAVASGNLVLIPSGDWHQLIASAAGLDYIEFQAPFDFVTTMDDDPLGKNWYIKGTDDGAGRPRLWVQS